LKERSAPVMMQRGVRRRGQQSKWLTEKLAAREIHLLRADEGDT
jgi:hypothetical protein